jgi:hypothetical protein
MELVYFIGAVVLLTALIYGTLNYHYRDKSKVADQIVRDCGFAGERLPIAGKPRGTMWFFA